MGCRPEIALSPMKLVVLVRSEFAHEEIVRESPGAFGAHASNAFHYSSNPLCFATINDDSTSILERVTTRRSPLCDVIIAPGTRHCTAPASGLSCNRYKFADPENRTPRNRFVSVTHDEPPPIPESQPLEHYCTAALKKNCHGTKRGPTFLSGCAQKANQNRSASHRNQNAIC